MATFIAPDNTMQITTELIHTEHHLGVDAELQKWVNTKNAHISVAEKKFIDTGYPYMNDEGKVDLQFHKVRVTIANGEEKLYNIEQWFPNNTIGLITCLLGSEVQ